MIRFCILFAFFLPLYATAYESPIAVPESQRTVFELGDPDSAHEYFGTLDDFPHTYTFIVPTAGEHTIRISVPDIPEQKQDVSVILVESKKRGVTEVGRTSPKDASWESKRSVLYAESFKEGGTLTTLLNPGQYILEVSAPNNDGKYRLLWGDGSTERSYFGNVRALFEVKRFLQHSYMSVFLSPLIFIPALLILSSIGLFVYRKRRS
jgi:hypothetical protein